MWVQLSCLRTCPSNFSKAAKALQTQPKHVKTKTPKAPRKPPNDVSRMLPKPSKEMFNLSGKHSKRYAFLHVLVWVQDLIGFYVLHAKVYIVCYYQLETSGGQEHDENGEIKLFKCLLFDS